MGQFRSLHLACSPARQASFVRVQSFLRTPDRLQPSLHLCLLLAAHTVCLVARAVALCPRRSVQQPSDSWPRCSGRLAHTCAFIYLNVFPSLPRVATLGVTAFTAAA